MKKSIILKGLGLSIILLIGIGISQMAANPIVVKSVYLDSGLASEESFVPLEHLTRMGYWEAPGAGSFYDDVGNVYKSPHVVKTQAPDNDPLFTLSDNPGFDWWENGYSKARLSWMNSMQWPVMEYHGLDSEARYTIRMTGVGEFYTYADGKALRPITERKQTGDIVELTIPQSLTKDGSLKLTWQQQDESHLNWRQHSRLNEVWLIKNEP